jgi:flavin-binding protein dodecin
MTRNASVRGGSGRLRCYGVWIGLDTEPKEIAMAVARVTEISSTSPKSFDDAIRQGIGRATKTLRNVRSAWVKEQRVDIKDDKIAEYQVNLMVTFVLED